MCLIFVCHEGTQYNLVRLQTMRYLIAGFALGSIVLIGLLVNFINQPVEKIPSTVPTTVATREYLQTLPTSEQSGITRVEGTTSIEIQPN
jgi:hypothetical protein